ncbi:hypothetical protein [Azospirillum sp. B21]|nr:hypothetical protein [Azospirillum sp. B21]
MLPAMQLCGKMPEPIRVKDAALGGVFNMGGTAVANCAGVLERIR